MKVADKQIILKNIANMTRKAIDGSIAAVTEDNLGVKVRVVENGYSKGYTFTTDLSGAFLISLFGGINMIESGNDAPKGGRNGDYIIIKNIKENRERFEFAKTILKTI